MKGWRERAAGIFTNHGAIAAKTKSALGPVPSDSVIEHLHRDGFTSDRYRCVAGMDVACSGA